MAEASASSVGRAAAVSAEALASERGRRRGVREVQIGFTGGVASPGRPLSSFYWGIRFVLCLDEPRSAGQQQESEIDTSTRQPSDTASLLVRAIQDSVKGLFLAKYGYFFQK
jgi:hypothetical protein